MGPLCFKTSSVNAKTWITKKKMVIPATEIPISSNTGSGNLRRRLQLTDERILVGIQFRFRNGTPENSQSRASLALEQVFINKTTGQISTRMLEEDILFNGGSLHYVVQNGNTVILEPAEQYLDHYETYSGFQHFLQEDYTMLVFFTKDQVKSLISYFDEIHVSGCQVNLGLKTTLDDESAHYEDKLLFNLKLEGSGFNPDLSKSHNAKNAAGEDDADEAISGFYLGAVCPPVWYITEAMISQVPGLNLKKRLLRKVYASVKSTYAASPINS